MRRSEDFLLTAEELRLRRRKRRRFVVGGISLILLLALVVVLGRPASHAIKRWQARRHAEKAFRLIDGQNWNEAQKEATAAYQLAPNEPEATRAVARFLSRVGQPQALEFWDRLAKQATLTRDDLRDEGTVALAVGETGRAATAIHTLLEGDGRDVTPRDWLLSAQLSAERGAPQESVDSLQHVFQSSAASPQERLQAAVLELRLAPAGTDQGEKTRADAWSRIEKLSTGKDAVGLDALVLLAQRELSQKAETLKPETLKSAPLSLTHNREPVTATSLATAIESHPLAQAPQHLLAVDLRMHAAPEDKAKLMQAAIDRWKEADIKSLVALATWLNGKGEFQRELDTIPQERAVQNRDLFLQRLDAFGALGEWDKIKQALNDEIFPLDPMISHMYLARCNVQLGEKTAADNNWDRALEAAGGDAQKLMTLADYAAKNGATAVAAKAYGAATEAAPKLRSAWQGRLRLAQASRDTAAIHSVLADMLEIWPKDSAIQNDEAYVRLLLATSKDEGQRTKDEVENEQQTRNAKRGTRNEGTTALSEDQLSDVGSQLSRIEALAEDLVKHDPASLPHRTLLALVYLKENRPATALGVYGNLHVPPNTLTPSALAVHAAVLQANGNTADAAKEAAQIPRSALLPEEAALLSGL